MTNVWYWTQIQISMSSDESPNLMVPKNQTFSVVWWFDGDLKDSKNPHPKQFHPPETAYFCYGGHNC